MMNDYIFLFDLDATITRQEILPELARQVDCYDEIRLLTERTMQGEIPFRTSFLQRVEILKNVPVSKARKIISGVELNEQVVAFIRENKERCRIVTGNLDIWIEELVQKIGMEGLCHCSKATCENDSITKVVSVIQKKDILNRYKKPIVAVGDGNNDAEMVGAASIGIGFGGVRQIAPSVMENADYAIYTEEMLCQFLKRLL